MQIRRRTIDRKTSKEALLNRMSKGLGMGNGKNEVNGGGQNGGGQNGCHTNGDKGEFDDLISALRAGDVFGEDLVKMRRNRRRANGSPHRISQTSTNSVNYSRENSRERALTRKWNKWTSEQVNKAPAVISMDTNSCVKPRNKWSIHHLDAIFITFHYYITSFSIR